MTFEDKRKLLRKGSWLSSDIIHSFTNKCGDFFDSSNVQVIGPYDVHIHGDVTIASHDPFVAVINETFSNSAVNYAKRKYHGGGTHWICVSNIPSINSGNEGNASFGIFDSMSKGCTTDDVTSFIKKIYDDGEVECVDINYFKVQHQYDGWSCGIHALANAMDLLLENDPYDTVIDVEKCARHVAFCLEKQVPYEFPSFKRTSSNPRPFSNLIGIERISLSET